MADGGGAGGCGDERERGVREEAGSETGGR